MKVSEFLGTRVLDKNGFEIGKVVDMFVEPKEGVINNIVISTGEFGLRRKDLEITTGDIEGMGDYVILNIEKAEVEERVEEAEEKSERPRVKLEKSD
jgi:sporulation protein YlmC with PRC-barrel domain